MGNSARSSAVESLTRYLEFSPVACAVTEGPTHAVRYANVAFRRLQTDGEIAIGPSLKVSERQPAELTPLLDRAFHRGGVIRDEVVAPRQSAERRWSCTVWPIAAATNGLEGLVLEVRDSAYVNATSHRQRAIAGRLLLGALREQDSARQAIEASRRASFLASASRGLAMSLDEDTTRDIVRRFSLPREGSWCIVDVVESDGSVRRLAAIHPDHAKAAFARTLAGNWFQSSGDRPLSTVTPLVITRDSRMALLAAARGPSHVATLLAIGFDALLVVPLIVRGTALGAITFVTSEGDPPISTDEMALASNLADLCAIALSNARLFSETNALRAAADVANRAKSAFLGSMSHELRTPLNVIGGYLELIEMGLRGPVTSEQLADFARIKHYREHLLALISEVLNFVGSESGRLEYHFANVLLGPVLTDVAEMLSRVADERKLTLDVRPSDVGASVWADESRLHQILMNLVTNALKYTPVGGGIITLSSAVTPDSVVIHVADQGPGIPIEHREAIFEPFVQLTSGLADRRGGVGLGLAISRDLARAMKGDITVDSTLGVGSRFALRLPRARDDASGSRIP
jgi:signal transduction histidine kinase